MKITIIGTGFAAEMHARVCAGRGDRIAMVVDRTSIEAARRFAEKYGAEAFSGKLEDALGADVDFVHICTIPTCHFEEARAALLAGKNVICEKPLCLDPKEALELAQLAGERGLINAVCFNVRFYEACGEMKARAASGSLGRIGLIHGEYMQEFHALPAEYSWRYDPKLAGPMRAVTEIGSHWFDTLRYITGEEVVSVSAEFIRTTPERTLEDGIMREADAPGEKIHVASEDAALVRFHLSGGAVGNVVLSEISHGRTNLLTFRFEGAHASVWWDSEEPYMLHSAEKGKGILTETRSFADGFGSTFRDLFAEAASGGRRCADFMDGYRNAAVCEAIRKSAENGGAVTEVGDIC